MNTVRAGRFHRRRENCCISTSVWHNSSINHTLSRYFSYTQLWLARYCMWSVYSYCTQQSNTVCFEITSSIFAAISRLQQKFCHVLPRSVRWGGPGILIEHNSSQWAGLGAVEAEDKNIPPSCTEYMYVHTYSIHIPSIYLFHAPSCEKPPLSRRLG